MGKVLFSQMSVCPHLEGGYPRPRFFPRWLVPGPLLRGTPVPCSFPGHWSQVLSRVTGTRSFLGVPQFQVLPRSLVGPFLGVPRPSEGTSWWSTPPGQDRTVVSPSQVRMGYPPGQVRMGYSLARSGWGTPQDKRAERALTMQQAVCLLRSRRSTTPIYFRIILGWFLLVTLKKYGCFHVVLFIFYLM